MAWTASTTGSSGDRIVEAWGGPNGGSWVYTTLPDNRAYHPDPAVEAFAVQNISDNVFTYLTGYEPGTTGYPNGVASYPYINVTSWTSEINVITQSDLDDPANEFEWMPLYMRPSGTPSRHIQAWAQPARARMEHMGIPVNPSILPSKLANGQPDSDGSLTFYLPDWKWPGNPADTRYWGLMINVWGARDPDSNVAFYNLPPVWTGKYGGYVTGVNNSLAGASFNRTSGADVTKPNSGTFIGTAPPVGARNPDGSFVNGDPNNLNRLATELPGAFGPAIAGQEAKTYPGWGRDGVAVETNAEMTAAHVSLSHNLIQKRDCARTCPIHGHPGFIDHSLGFLMSTERPNTSGNFVYPAAGYDGSSRTNLPHGSRLRLPPGYYNSATKTGWTNAQHMFVCQMERHGVVFYDTNSGTGVAFRAEPGTQGLNGMSLTNATMKKLPWPDLRLLSVGSAANPNPVTTGADITAPTVLSRTPTTGAINVTTGAVISVTFSESVFGVAAGSTFTVTRSGTAVSGTVSGSGTSRTFTPSSALLQGTTYTVSLTSGITDAAGNALAATSWAFTTASAPTDTTAPTLAIQSPSPGAVNIPRNSPISITFSEAVQGVSGTTFRTINSDTGAAVSGIVSGSGTTYTLTPSAPLDPDTPYTIQLVGGTTAIRDTSNNAFSSTNWTFTTVAPQIKARRTRIKPAGTAASIAQITATTSISAGTVIVPEGVLS